MIRLDRFLSNMGQGTRKDVRKLIAAGAACVNGAVVTDSAKQIDENKDAVLVRGVRVEYRPFVYLMMNKPAGILSATEDARGAATAVDLLNESHAHYRVAPAGRLDKDSEGFLLLTNDGDYIHRVTSPAKHVYKKYYVELDREAEPADIEAFRRGIVLEDGTVCCPALLEIKSGSESPSAYVTICEGKYHQVKRMFAARKNHVQYLKRIQIGSVCLDETLHPGEYREMSDQEKENILHGNIEIEVLS